jgi:hypothetical protein
VVSARLKLAQEDSKLLMSSSNSTIRSIRGCWALFGLI